MPRENRCMYMAHVCFMSVVVTVWGSVGMFVEYRPLLKIVFLSLGVLKYVLCLCCKVCDGYCVFCLYCDTWSGRDFQFQGGLDEYLSALETQYLDGITTLSPLRITIWTVSSCRCCMLVSCVHPVAVLNAAICMTCSLSMLVEDARGDHMEEEYYR